MLFDLDVVSDNIDRLREAIPQAEIYYAVKANSEPALLKLLAESDCRFDVASPGEAFSSSSVIFQPTA
ncbi:hypothetical protein FS847_13110 [Streptomyces sp. ISID311]|nr:hypothetical protein FS847_13110 [Streptomyces sp. ISID311]